MYWPLRVCEAHREYLFHNFMNGRGIRKTEGLNGRGPKNEALTRGVSKSSHEWKGISKFSTLCAITEQNRYEFVAVYVTFKNES